MTYSGEHFELLHPDPRTVRLEDIAHANSQNCRYTGHTRFFYSVLQHTLLGAYKMALNQEETINILHFMLHDASEAYACDIPRPLKPLLSNYMEIEDIITKAIYAHFDITEPTKEQWAVVKKYDDYMLGLEIPILMPQPEEFNVQLFYDDKDIPIGEMSMAALERIYIDIVPKLINRVKKENEKQASSSYSA